MRKVPAAMLASLFFTLLFTATAFATPPQSDCSALNPAKGEGKFTGKISSVPDGSSMNVTYGDQTVLVHYTSSVTVCQGGQPASLSALTQGASVSVFGPLRRNGSSMEIDAARIFVAGRPQTAQTSPVPAQPKAQEAPPAQPSQAPAQPYTPQAQPYAQQAQPRVTNSHPIPNSVILGGGTHATTMQRLHVVRKYALPDLRTNSQVTLGIARLDFRPMLDNPKAVFNVAQRLRAIPQHVQVQEETSEITEVDQGLVIHHVVSYRILPGKCSDPNARAELSRAGIECFTRASVGERVAEFSKPGAPHYVAAPEKRQAAIAAFQRNNPLADADASKGVAELRKSLANPSQRAAITAQIGQTETARLGSLTDDQLKEEMINSAAQRIEETMFVPKLESTNYAHPQHALANATNTGEMTAVQQLLREGVPEHGVSPSNFPKLLKVVPATALHHPVGSAAPGGDKPADLEIGPYIFLTGFTIGHDYEWSWGVSVTINWCVLGCSSTYSVDLHAGFNYGFGLRFPIHTQFKYHTVVHGNNSAEADLTATFEPIEGTVNDFFSAGLSADQMYDGKELVAQVGANAGFDYNLPVVGSGGQGFNVGVDFTDLLPAPYTHGKFLPPAPGAHGIDSPYVFNTIDLLGDLFNFGAVGGAVYPAVNVNLHSNKLEFTLNDEILRRQTRLTKTGQTVSLGVSPIANGNESHFSIGNPVYNLGFTLTPGLAPTVFVDVAVWSNTWAWPVWFPQLAVDLPPNGIDFGCHAGTTCVIDFTEVYDASTGQVRDVSKEADVADRTLTGGGCQLVGARTSGQPGKYLCPVKGMLGLCQAMLKNDAVASCGALVPNVVDEILKRGHCTSSDGAYVCPGDMMGLCDVYLKNQEILSCKQK